MSTISLSLAKPGKEMPGPYSSLMHAAEGALSRFAERGEIGGRRHRRARWSIHSGQRRAHSGRCGACARHSGEARDRLWRGGSRPPILFNPASTPFRVWRCFVRDQARVPSVAGAGSSFFVTGTVFFKKKTTQGRERERFLLTNILSLGRDGRTARRYHTGILRRGV